MFVKETQTPETKNTFLGGKDYENYHMECYWQES